MGNVAYCVEVRTRFGHFNSASLLAISEVRLARWVIHRHPIQNEPVIMEAWHSRWCCHTPDAVGSLGHWKWSGTQTITAGDLHAVRLGCLQRDVDRAVRSDARSEEHTSELQS